MNFSKGPWEVAVRPDPEYIDVVTDAGKGTIAAVRRWAGMPAEERAANAVVIALAPKMVEALQLLLNQLPSDNDDLDSDGATARDLDAYDRLIAVLEEDVRPLLAKIGGL